MKNELRVLRARHNLSQAGLAEKPNVSRQTVIAIEAGRYDPSLPLALRALRDAAAVNKDGTRAPLPL